MNGNHIEGARMPRIYSGVGRLKKVLRTNTKKIRIKRGDNE